MTMNRIEVIEKKKKIRKRVRSESSNFTLVWFSVLSCMVGVVWCCVVLSCLLFFSSFRFSCVDAKREKNRKRRERERDTDTDTDTKEREREETLSSLLRNLFKDFLNSKVEVVNV